MAITKKTVAPKAVPDAVVAQGVPKFTLVKETPNQYGAGVSQYDTGGGKTVEVHNVGPALEAAEAKWVNELKDLSDKAGTTQDPLAAEIDALGNMEGKIAAMKKEIAAYGVRVNVVRDKLVDMKELSVVGNTYYALVKEEGNKVRKVKDMALAVKHLGVETFLAVAKIGLADIDKYLTDAQKAEVIETSESTTRSMKILKRV